MSKDDCKVRDTKVAASLRKLIEANHFLADMESLEALMPMLLDLLGVLQTLKLRRCYSTIRNGIF